MHVKRPPAADILDQWLADRQMSRFQLCVEMGIHPGMFWAWCRGKTRPSLVHAARIEALTGIPPRAWLHVEADGSSNPGTNP